MPKSKPKRRKPKPILLTAIREAAKAQGVSPLKLAKMQRGAHPVTCQAFLYSGRDARVSTVEAMMRALGLVVVSKAELRRLRDIAADEDSYMAEDAVGERPL